MYEVIGMHVRTPTFLITSYTRLFPYSDVHKVFGLALLVLTNLPLFSHLHLLSSAKYAGAPVLRSAAEGGVVAPTVWSASERFRAPEHRAPEYSRALQSAPEAGSIGEPPPLLPQLSGAPGAFPVFAEVHSAPFTRYSGFTTRDYSK
ncbi:hypothetical protein BDV93DRAFT_511962 [Ceratobasidium sp. AG-I]|nr:hypothetical protein BDV93DRAFT_511962 [Ceratobasidium sp. AG-I]